jgi:Ca-activated chloride channel homolog
MTSERAGAAGFIHARAARLIAAVLLACPLPILPLVAFHGGPAPRRQAVYVVAARDSRLLTMCPEVREVKLASGRTWKPNGNLFVRAIGADEQRISFPDTHASVALPVPVAGPAGSRSGQPLMLDRVELDRDRIAPDAGIKARVEQEFLKQHRYDLVDSPEKADLVFLVEGSYVSLAAWSAGDLTTGGMATVVLGTGDREANLLQAVLGIVVPADIYRRARGDLTVLMPARVWEGSAVDQPPSRTITEISRDVRLLEMRQTFESASPESVVRQFHEKEKRPLNHPALCAASDQPFIVQGVDRKATAVESERKNAGTDLAALPGRDPELRPQVATFRSAVTYVPVPVVVTDNESRMIGDLQPQDFRVFEDDVEQKVDRVMLVSEPFNLALLVDTSSSMKFRIEEVQRAILAFISVLRADDRLMVVSFDRRIFLQAELTSDRSRLRRAVFQMGGGSGTRLYDTIEVVSASRLDQLPERKAIVLFTDGVDNRSRLSDAASTLARTGESHAPVYAIRYDTSGDLPPVTMSIRLLGEITSAQLQPRLMPEGATDNRALYERATQYLTAVVESSGGRLYQARTPGNLDEAFLQIAQELSLQYTLCYYPTQQARDGTYRRIRVEVDRPDVTVRTRSGYRARQK